MAHKEGKGHTNIKHTDEAKRKMSESLKRRYAIYGHPQTGRKCNEITKNKISKANKGRKDSIETRMKKSESRNGDKNPMFGKPCSKTRKENISKANKGHKFNGKACPKCEKIHPDKTGENNPTGCGKLNPFFGKHHTEKTLNKVRGENNSSKRPEVRRKMRIAKLRYIEEKRNNGEPISPVRGKFEKPVLDNLEKCFGYKILRQHRALGYFIDGYCPMLHMAIEIDEPEHFIGGKLKEKDLYRQQEIEQELGYKFLRIRVPRYQKTKNLNNSSAI